MYPTQAYCSICNKPLDLAPAKIDGEPTYIGYLPCKKHYYGDVIYIKRDILATKETEILNVKS